LRNRSLMLLFLYLLSCWFGLND